MTRNSRADFGLGEGAGRLVHDEDVGCERQGLGDLDELLIADAQASDRLRGGRVAFQLFEQPGRRGVHRPVIEQAESAAQLAAQEDIGGDRQLFDQVQLLVDDADARLLGVARR